jgi:hypothetical protein
MKIPINWNSNNSANKKLDAKSVLTESPNEITLSENVKVLRFSPVESSVSQNKAMCQLAVFAFIPEGETITFSFLDSLITLTASTTPTSGEFLTESVAPSAALLSVYLESVSESISDTLEQILSFGSNYIISMAGASIGVMAKSYGEKFNISSSSSAAGIYNQSTTGTSKYLAQNVIDYSAFADLYVGFESFSSQVNKFSSILIDRYLVPSGESEASILLNPVGDYVSPILPLRSLSKSSDFLVMDSGVSGAGLSVPSEDENGGKAFLLRPYFVVYGDSFRYISNGQRKRIVKGVSPVRWVQLGALDELRPYDMSTYVWLPETENTFDWLSSRPENESLTYESHAFLQLICKKPTQAAITANIEIKYMYYDGTFELVNLSSFDFSNQEIAGNLSFDVSPVALGLKDHELLNGKLVDSYEVKLKWSTQGGVSGKSKVKKYVMDRNIYNSETQIVFLNEFGAWDSVGFRGSIQKSPNRTKNTITRSLPFDANTINAISKEVSLNVDIEIQTVKTVHSGLMNTVHYNWVIKILESTAVYEWNNDLQAYESIDIRSYDYKPNTSDGSGSISVSYTRTVNNNTIKR